jgi:hypothetical protein
MANDLKITKMIRQQCKQFLQRFLHGQSIKQKMTFFNFYDLTKLKSFYILAISIKNLLFVDVV